MEGICKHCKGELKVRNPKGYCDHLYYPDYCDVCKKIEGVGSFVRLSNKLVCPNCEEPLSFVEQMNQWDEEYAEGAIIDEEFPIMIALLCPNKCDDVVATVWIEKEVLEVPPDLAEKIKNDIEKHETHNQHN